MSKIKYWTQHEVNLLKELILEGHHLTEVAKKLNRSSASVSNKAQRLGYYKLHNNFRPNNFYNLIPPKDSLSVIWRRHPVHTNYWVSDTGLVWTGIRGRELQQYRFNHKTMSKKGLWVSITRDGKEGKPTKVSHMVAETWLNRLPGQSVLHRDRNKENNDISNLIVVNPKKAGQISGHLSGKARAVAHLTSDGRIIKVYRSSRQAAKDLGVSYQTILDYVNGKVKKPKINIRFYEKRKRGDN